ncbi:DMT family transporter [Paenibacillus marinisediminis]
MKRSWIADLCLLFIALIWGSTFIVVQAAVQILPPLSFNAVRFLGAACLFILFILISDRSLKRFKNRRLLLHGSILGVILFGGYAFQTIGLLHTTTTNTGFITGLSVVLVPFFTMLMKRSKLAIQTWTAAAIALFGLYLLTFNGANMSWNKGDMLVFLCSICFALQIAVTDRFASLHDTLTLVTVQLGTVGILATIGALLFEPLQSPSALLQSMSEPLVLGALLVSIGLSTAFAFLAQTWAQQYTSPSRVAIIYAMEPVFAAITGVTFANEQLGAYALAGCALIFVSMVTAELKWKPSKVQLDTER